MIKHYLILLAALIAAPVALCALPTDFRSVREVHSIASHDPSVTAKTLFFDRPQATVPVVSRADEDMVTIKVEFVYDKTKYAQPNNAIFWNGNDSYGIYGEDGVDEYELQLPAGTYYMHAGFTSGRMDTPLTVIIHEAVTVADGDVVVIDAAEATELFSFKPVLPDGQNVEPSTAKVNDMGEFDGYASEGNVSAMVVNSSVDLSVYGKMYNLFGEFEKVEYPDGTVIDGSAQFNILLNRCPEDVTVEYAYVFITKDGENAIGAISAQASNPGMVTNVVSDYEKITYSFNDPAYQTDEAKDFKSFYLIYSDKDYISGTTYISTKAKSCDFWFAKGGAVKKNVAPIMAMGCQVNFFDFEVAGNPTIGMTTPPIGIIDGGGELVIGGYNYAVDKVNVVWEVNLSGGLNPFVNNDAMSIKPATSVTYGNSVPFTSFLSYAAKDDVPDDFASSWDWNFVGAMGEVRNGDKTNSDTRVLYNGEEIFSSYADMNMWEWFGNNPAPGTYDINIENRNVTVDGEIPGRSVCRTHIDMAQADFQPPVLSWLQYRDKQGQLCDRFDKAEGSIVFTAGKLDYQINQDWMTEMAFTDADFTVKVMYSPNRYGDWQELTAVENPSNFFAAGYGKYFTVDLAQIVRNSSNGWFDLRFELTDAVGNSQIQSIEPAFKIEALTALEKISSDDETEISVVDGMIVAPEGSRVYNLSGIECVMGQLQSGLYIVVTPAGHTVKVVI